MLTFVPLNDYLIQCGESKALNALALSDCCVLALAEYKGFKALFKRKKEIEEQLQRIDTNQYTERIVFIEDLKIKE